MADFQYQGPERRIHKVYVTHNTEYHVRKGVCVAVKPRRSTIWIEEHGALFMRLDGVVKDGFLLDMPRPATLGARLYFTNGDREILTSPVVEVARPEKNVVLGYPKECDTQPECAVVRGRHGASYNDSLTPKSH